MKEKIVRILCLETANDDDCLFIFRFAAKEERDHRSGFYGSHGASGKIVVQHLHAFGLRSGDACEAENQFESPGQSSDHVLIGSDDQLRVDISGVDLQNL